MKRQEIISRQSFYLNGEGEPYLESFPLWIDVVEIILLSFPEGKICDEWARFMAAG